MIKGAIYIITILTLSFFATSCCPRKTVEIEEEDKLQIKENDMFVYKSNLGNYDTLFIREIRDRFPFRDNSEDFCPRNVYKEQLEYYYDNYTDPFPEDSLLYLKLIYQWYNNDLYLTVNVLPSPDPVTNKEGLGWIGATLGVYFIGDSIYEDVQYPILPIRTSKDEPYKFFINKEYGFLSYEYRTGEKYELYKYIPKN